LIFFESQREIKTTQKGNPQMHTLLANRRQILVFVLVGIFVLLAAASVPVLSAPPEPEPERSYYQPLLLDPQLRLAAPETNYAAAPTAPQALTEGEGWGYSVAQHLSNDNWDIFIRDGTTGIEIPIAASSHDEIQPRLRRGADRVAYISNLESGYEVWTMNPDGSDQRRLTNGRDAYYPNWSPDGTRIVFESILPDDETEVFVINADGSGLTQLTFSPGYDGMASWAPDGSHLLFVSYRSGGYRIWRMNPDGSNLAMVNTTPYSMHPYYSPDGQRIAFDALDTSGFSELYFMDTDGSGATHLYSPGDEDTIVTGWSPDGRKILFTHINWTQINGYWYWTAAFLRGIEPSDWLNERIETYTTSGLDLNMDWQSTDNQPPDLSLLPLRAESGSPVHLHVRGSDPGSSGLDCYSIQWRQPGGVWQDLVQQALVSEPVSEFTGSRGESYEFRVRGQDRGGNIEAWPETPDASTRIEAYAPITNFIAAPDYARGETTLRYQASDVGGSAIENYDVQRYDSAAGLWTLLAEATTDTQIKVSGQPGEQASLRVRARDHAGNLEAWPQAGAGGFHTVTFYSSAATGTAYAHSGGAIPGVLASMEPDFLIEHLSHDPQGQFATYANTPVVFNAVYSKPGYGSLPETHYGGGDHALDLYLPPADDLVLDGDFETPLDDSASPWAVSGDFPLATATHPEECHTGNCVSLSRVDGYFAPIQQLFPLETRATLYQTRLGGDDSIHVVGSAGPEIYYRQRTVQGAWLPLETLHTEAPEYLTDVVLEGDHTGAAHLLYNHSEQIFYQRRSPSGDWSSPRQISGAANAISMGYAWDVLKIDPQGGLHVLWQCNYDEGVGISDLCYAHRTPQGTWSAPVWVDSGISYGSPVKMLVTSGGVMHAAWAALSGDRSMVRTAWRTPGGEWSSLQDLGQIDYWNFPVLALALDANELPMLAWHVYGDIGSYLNMRWVQADGSWSPLQEQFLAESYAGNLYFLKIVFDGQARLHIINTSNGLHAIWPRGGQLEHKSSLLPNILYVNAFQVGKDGRIYLISQRLDIWLSYTVVEDGQILETIDLNDDAGFNAPHQMLLDQDNNAHFFLQTYGAYEGMQVALYHHYGPAVAAEDASGVLTQTFHIPEAMAQAGLSFLYRLSGGQEQGSSALSAWVDAGSGAQEVLHIRSRSKTWEHAWVDLSAYAGQTITLSLSMDQAAGEVRTYGYLDEVSLGSGYGDAWLGVQPADRNVPPGEAFELEVAYGNQGGFALPGAVVEVNLPLGLELVAPLATCAGGPPAYSCSLGELAAGAQGSLTLSLRTTPVAPFNQRLDLGLRLGTTGSELELLNNQLTVGLIPANALYLPSIGNWWAGN
jgi:hypothetical protein